MATVNVLSPFLRRIVPWTCRACLRRQALVSSPPQRKTFATKLTAKPAQKPKGKRGRRLAYVAGGLGIVAALTVVNEDAKHAVTAVQRSSRVATTLFVNINEYVHAISPLNMDS
jgi:aarF domain-containing kinase